MNQRDFIMTPEETNSRRITAFRVLSTMRERPNIITDILGGMSYLYTMKNIWLLKLDSACKTNYILVGDHRLINWNHKQLGGERNGNESGEGHLLWPKMNASSRSHRQDSENEFASSRHRMTSFIICVKEIGPFEHELNGRWGWRLIYEAALSGILPSNTIRIWYLN